MAGEWESTTLGTICRFAAGSAFPKAEQGDAIGKYPFIKVSDMNLAGNERYITTANNWVTEKTQSQLRAKVHPTGATVFAKIGVALTYNRRRILTQPTLIDNNMMAAIPTDGIVDPLFLYYLLCTVDFNDVVVGTALPYLNISDLSRIPIRLPSLDEQRAIAHILGTLDDKIELNRRMNRTLEEMARAIFKSWFVDFDPVRAKAAVRREHPKWTDEQVSRAACPNLKPEIAALFPDSFEDSELGEIPKGWRSQSFTDDVEVIGGGTPKTSNPEYWGGDIPWFSVVDTPAAGEVFVICTDKTITQDGVNNSSTRILPIGTTIISARGTVGNLALVAVPMAMNQSCYGLHDLRGHNGYFLYFATSAVVETLRQRTHGSVFNTITRDTLKSVRVVTPPNALITEFERIVGAMLQRLLSALLESRTLAAIRDTLLPKLISGELRVQDAERIVGRCV